MRLPFASLWLYKDLFSGSEINAVQSSLLGFGVNQVVVDRIRRGLVPVGKEGLVPMFIRYTFSFVGGDRASG